MSIPVHVIFSPSWWNRRYGIEFEEPFYLDPRTRIRNDLAMRTALFELFELGAPPFEPRPVVGSPHIAGGFVMPALLGVPIRFSKDQAAWPVPRNLDRDAVLAMRASEATTTWPMQELISQANALEKEFGYLVGDLNTAGILNTSMEVRGNDLLLDLIEAPEVTDHLFNIVSRTMIEVSRYWRARTGTTSVSVNCSIAAVGPETTHSDASFVAASSAFPSKKG